MTDLQAIECAHGSYQITVFCLSLELNVKIQPENTAVCMANLLPLNGHMSSHFDTIHLTLSTHAYFAVLFRAMRSKYGNSKNIFL